MDERKLFMIDPYITDVFMRKMLYDKEKELIDVFE